jgi:glucose/arabinose dehydrogenase
MTKSKPNALSRRETLIGLAAFPLMPRTAQAAQTNAPKTAQSVRPKTETIASGLVHPWALAFLQDGRIIVTERPGRIRIISEKGDLSPPLAGVPRVYAQGQGGLLDLVVAPDFKDSRTLYIAYAEPHADGSGAAIARARLNAAGTGLEGVNVIFRQQPFYSGSLQFGARIIIADDGSLFITLGERYDLRDQAQSLVNTLGKVVRINADGSVPPNNPFIGRKDAMPEIYSYGHRNPQGAALHPITRELWIIEHGPRGGDEVNIIRPGRNYGWPIITYGIDYSGAQIGIGPRKEGMEQPIYFWVPSIAPSGMAFYTGNAFPEWRGNLFVGALAGQHLARLVLDGETVTGEERLLEDRGGTYPRRAARPRRPALSAHRCREWPTVAHAPTLT